MKRKVVGALGLTLALTTVSLNVANAAPKKKPAKTEQVREAPQSAEISKAMGDLKWGTSRDDVLQYYKNQVKAKYKPLLAKATGALEEDKLLKKQADELSAISRSVVEFDGSKTGIDAGFLRTEFTHHNSESMFSTTDDHSKNYYFFINGKLWKWYKAFEASAFNGKSFDEFAAAIQERYGKAQVREGDLGTGSKSRWLEWQDTQTRLRAVDNKQFYGFYSLVFESKDVVQKLPQLRAHKADTAPKGHALVDSVTNGDDGPNDNEKDIVDRITGKMRVRQDAPAGTPATAGTTGKKSPTAAAPAPSTGTAEAACGTTTTPSRACSSRCAAGASDDQLDAHFTECASHSRHHHAVEREVCARAAAVAAAEANPHDPVLGVDDFDARAIRFEERRKYFADDAVQFFLHGTRLPWCVRRFPVLGCGAARRVFVLPPVHAGLASSMGHDARSRVNRYRLRFLLQELDLSGPEVLIGRSPECQITLEDPLVSRRHAVIEVRPESAVISDLGSRNGVRINGSLIAGPAQLSHNDRVRLGTQDLVFLVAEAPTGVSLPSRPTGRIRQCGACARPFPGEAPVCPHCGSATEPPPGSPFEAVTDLMLEPDAGWALRLLLDVIRRALDGSRPAEAERGFARAQREVDARLADGRLVEAVALTRLAEFAVELSRASRTPERLSWVLGAHSQRGQLPDASLIDHIISLDMASRAVLRPAVEQLLASWGASGIGQERPDTTLRVQRLRSWLGAAA